MKHFISLSLVIALLSACNTNHNENNSKTESFDEIQSFGSYGIDWALIIKDEKKGFIDRDGLIIVDPVYDQIGPFGPYGINWALVEKNGKQGFIDSTGKEIIPPKYDSFGAFGAVNNDWARVELDDKFGFIDRSGKIIVEIQNPI